jgi:hypothetical protein
LLSAMPTAHVFGLGRRWWLWVAHLVERGTNGCVCFAVEKHCAGLGFGSGGEDGLNDGGMDVNSNVLRDDVAFRLGVAVGSFGDSLRKL